jgi:hypothetical protein
LDRSAAAAGAGGGHDGWVYVPVVCCKRQDLVLRREAVHLLSTARAAETAADAAAAATGAAPVATLTSPAAALAGLHADLVYLDDLTPEVGARLRELAGLPAVDAGAGSGGGAVTPSRLRITLVDHNRLTGPLATWGLSGCVVRMLDHHKDTGAHPVSGA